MDQLREKLHDYTEAPPERVWQQVESALDQELPAISKKLSAFSTAPPSGLWNKIESELEGKKEQAKIFPIRKAIRIAAAAVLLFAVFMTVRMFTPESVNNQVTLVPETPASAPVLNAPDQPDTPEGEEPVRNTNPTITKSLTKSPLPPLPDKKQQPAKKARYTTMSNDEGQTVRLSKKIAPVFDCADAKIKAISARCKEDIRALQEKIAMSLTSPSADFSGLIDLLKSLENEQ